MNEPTVDSEISNLPTPKVSIERVPISMSNPPPFGGFTGFGAPANNNNANNTQGGQAGNTTGTTNPPSIFGGAGLFGGGSTTTTGAGGGGLFGSGTTAPTGGGLFGNTAASTTPATQQPATSLFGNTANTSTTAPGAAPPSIFGSKPGGSIFGQLAASTTAPAAGSLFGQQQTTTTGVFPNFDLDSELLNSWNIGGGGIFGGGGATGGGLFGAKPATTTPASTGSSIRIDVAQVRTYAMSVIQVVPTQEQPQQVRYLRPFCVSWSASDPLVTPLVPTSLFGAPKPADTSAAGTTGMSSSVSLDTTSQLPLCQRLQNRFSVAWV